jgi:methylmalonyl-CoA/ethylmalonyl-CoA epimerase
MPTIRRIDHLAILVEDIDQAAAFWRDGLGMSIAHQQDVPAEQARIAFLPVGDGEIELVQPTTTDSGLRRYLEKRGPGMHHVCLQVDDIEAMLAQLQEKGFELINATPRTSQDGKKYAFIHPKSSGGVLVELYELPEYDSSPQT